MFEMPDLCKNSAKRHADSGSRRALQRAGRAIVYS